MSRSSCTAIAVCLSLLRTTPLSAHHSAVLFDVSKILTMTGTLSKVDWRNPHVGVFVDVEGDVGTAGAWAFETGAPSWFRGRMIGRAEFEKAIGQRVIV